MKRLSPLRIEAKLSAALTMATAAWAGFTSSECLDEEMRFMARLRR